MFKSVKFIHSSTCVLSIELFFAGDKINIALSLHAGTDDADINLVLTEK